MKSRHSSCARRWASCRDQAGTQRTGMRALIEFEIRRTAGTQVARPGNPPVQPGTAGSTVVQTESREFWGILQRHFTPTTPNFNFQQVHNMTIIGSG